MSAKVGTPLFYSPLSYLRIALTTFIARRLLFALVLLAAVSLFTYLLFALLPTDPAALTCGKNCKPELIEANRVRLGYDKPIHEQYFQFVKGIFTGRTYGTGDIAFTCPAPSLGYSFNQHECVSTLIAKTFPVTAFLSLGAFILWMLLGVGTGTLAALHRGKWQDRLTSVITSIGVSLPTFYVGLLVLFSVVIWLQWLPFPHYASPTENLHDFLTAMILPWITLAIAYAAIYTRFTRAALLETLGEDYIRTARAKGVGERVVFFKHTLRAVLAPLITLAGLDFAGLIGGAIITETIFNLPGLGRLTLRSVYEFDLAVVLATTILAAVVVIVMNLIVDMLYAVLDPRVRIT